MMNEKIGQIEDREACNIHKKINGAVRFDKGCIYFAYNMPPTFNGYICITKFHKGLLPYKKPSHLVCSKGKIIQID